MQNDRWQSERTKCNGFAGAERIICSEFVCERNKHSIGGAHTHTGVWVRLRALYSDAVHKSICFVYCTALGAVCASVGSKMGI